MILGLCHLIANRPMSFLAVNLYIYNNFNASCSPILKLNVMILDSTDLLSKLHPHKSQFYYSYYSSNKVLGKSSLQVVVHNEKFLLSLFRFAISVICPVLGTW